MNHGPRHTPTCFRGRPGPRFTAAPGGSSEGMLGVMLRARLGSGVESSAGRLLAAAGGRPRLRVSPSEPLCLPEAAEGAMGRSSPCARSTALNVSRYGCTRHCGTHSLNLLKTREQPSRADYGQWPAFLYACNVFFSAVLVPPAMVMDVVVGSRAVGTDRRPNLGAQYLCSPRKARRGSRCQLEGRA